MRFSTKLACLILLLVLSASGIITYVVYTSNLKTLKSQIIEKIQDDAFHIMDKIDRMLFERYADIIVFSIDPIISSKDSTQREITKRLIEYRNQSKFYISLSFFDINRIKIADTGAINIGEEYKIDWLEECLEQGIVSAASHIRFEDELGTTVVIFAAPVRDAQGKIFGAIVSRMPILKLYEITKGDFLEDEIPQKWDIDLVNRKGIMIYSSYNRKGILSQKLPDWEKVKKEIKGKTKGILSHFHQTKTHDIHVFMREQGYLDFKGNNWTMHVHIPEKLAFEPAIALRNKLVVILLFISVLYAIIVLMISRLFSKPITAMKEAVDEISRGRLDMKVAITTDDEIGKLAEAFNNMTANLAKTTVSRDYIDNIFRFMLDSLVVVSLDGIIKTVNSSACSLLGYSEAELKGQQFDMILSPESPFREPNLKEVLDKGYLKDFDNIYLTKDKKKVHVLFACSVMRNKSGFIQGIVCIAKDITDLKKAEEKAKLHARQLIRADKMASLGVMVSGVAHEINNPNNFIMFNTPILAKIWQDIISVLEKRKEEIGDYDIGNLSYNDVQEEIPKLLKGISDGSFRIKNIVAKLQNFSKITPSGGSNYLDINDALKNTISFVENVIKKKTNNFSVNYGKNIPQLRGNINELEQIFVNLIVNACQALPDKESALRIVTSHDAVFNNVSVTIEDEGVGISKNNLEKIMDPFFTTKSGSGGTGLGLSISYGIVRDHDGTLEFSSKIGVGTTVIVTLPCE